MPNFYCFNQRAAIYLVNVIPKHSKTGAGELESFQKFSVKRSIFADISVQSLVTTFRHRVLVLFKLLLLEKKVIYSLL